MLTVQDAATMAYVNMFAVLGALENLCELAPEARALISGKPPISIGFAVKNGPEATLTFADGVCRLSEGCGACTIKLPFSSCEKFNGLINGTVTPMPSKGITKIFFLLKTFVPLTDILSKYLRPKPEDLTNQAFRETSTKLMLYTAAAAVSQVANHDRSGRFSASQTPDGDIAINVKDTMGVCVTVKDHRMTTIKRTCASPRAVMEFTDLDTAGQLLRGEVSAMACVCNGGIAMGGMLNMIDNINRVLDRVGQYLA